MAEEREGVYHKDRLIVAKPYFRRELQNWGFMTVIVDFETNEATSYSAGNSFETASEAKAAAIGYGRQIINGKVEPRKKG
jgi:hypothetical protein